MPLWIAYAILWLSTNASLGGECGLWPQQIWSTLSFLHVGAECFPPTPVPPCLAFIQTTGVHHSLICPFLLMKFQKYWIQQVYVRTLSHTCIHTCTHTCTHTYLHTSHAFIFNKARVPFFVFFLFCFCFVLYNAVHFETFFFPGRRYRRQCTCYLRCSSAIDVNRAHLISCIDLTQTSLVSLILSKITIAVQFPVHILARHLR